MLKVKLDVLKQVDVIDEIVVNTDSDIAMEIADDCGVSKCVREDYYASSKCNNSEFFQNIAENTDTDYIIYSPCTAPLIKVDTYYDFINRTTSLDEIVDYIKVKNYKSIFLIIFGFLNWF